MEHKISVIRYGINSSVPETLLTGAQARQELGVGRNHKVMLFFGNIAPYKGLEYLIAALARLAGKCADYRLVIAGRPKDCENYWREIQQAMARGGIREQIIQRIEYIADEKVEVFFKAADVLILPYAHIFQSGVLFLGYSFGLPAIAADVGSLREDIIEGRTGSVFRPKDDADLAKAIESYFSSALFRELEVRRSDIRAFANERHSWGKAAAITKKVYESLV